jgi:single-strand DNA-binding protein
MAGLNKAILIGNLGRDPEIRTIDSGVKVATFSMATTESYRNKAGEKIDMTDWHNIVLWRGLAEIAEKYLNKGNKVYVEGRIRTRSYDDKDGNKKYITEIIGDNMILLGTPPEKQADNSQEPMPENNDAGTPKDGDDLPF